MRRIFLGAKFLVLNLLNRNRDPYFEILSRLYGKDYFNFAIDVGAASGDWSTSFVKCLGIKNVQCLEPNKEFYMSTWIGCLPYSLTGTIKIHDAAISSQKTEVYLIFRENGRDLRYRSFISEKVEGNQEGVPVRCFSLDDLERMPGPGILKIDVEGSELDVLQSGGESFFKRIGCIVFEHNIDSGIEYLDKICGYLKGFEFEVWCLQNNELFPISVVDHSARKEVNLIALKK